MTHTPKPWYQNENNQIFSIDGNVLIATPYFSIAMTVEEYKANVRLIAACPTMYKYIEDRAKLGSLTARKLLEEINAAS